MSVRIYETEPNRDGYDNQNTGIVFYDEQYNYCYHTYSAFGGHVRNNAYFSFDTRSLRNAAIYDAEIWVKADLALGGGNVNLYVASDLITNPLTYKNLATWMASGTNIATIAVGSAGWKQTKIPTRFINSGGWTDFYYNSSSLNNNSGWLIASLENAASQPYLIIYDAEGKKVVEDIITNIYQSLFYYVSGTQYIKENLGTSGTLRSYFPNLTFTRGYPDNIKKSNLPIIAIDYIGTSNKPKLTYGTELEERTHSFRLYGFAGQYNDDGLNQFEQKQLANDLYHLLKDARLHYYRISGSSFDEKRELDVSRASLMFETNLNSYNYCERYRFIIDCDLTD